MSTSITAVILAAGKGTRMKSSRAKVLHEVFFKPMVHHVLDTVSRTSIEHCALIIGHQREEVLQSVQDYSLTPVFQEEQLGTGHAVLCAEAGCSHCEQVMILCGDTPLIHPETLEDMVTQHNQHKSQLTVMTTLLDNPFGYGRIVSDTKSNILEIVEQKDADEAQRKIKEVNAGIYLVDRNFLFKSLKQVGTDNSQGEVYLTDIVAIANRQGLQVQKYVHPNALDVLGVNSRIELALAHGELQMRRNKELMLSGVTMYNPETIVIEPGCTVKQDAVLHPNIHISGATTIGSGATLAPGCVLHNCHIGDKAVIGANAVLSNCSIDSSEHIPPLTHRVG